MKWALDEMFNDGNLMGHNVRSALNGTDINAIMRGLSDWERYGGSEEGYRYRYGAQLLEALRQGTINQNAAKNSVQSAQTPKKKEEKPKKDDKDFTGAQITVELGFNSNTIAAYSFLHTGISYDISNKTLNFEGTVATWVLTQIIKSTAYQDTTLQAIAQKMCDNYGLTLSVS